MTDNYVESESNSPSIMHDRGVVIWAVEIVCHLFPEVMYVLCQKNKKKHLHTHFVKNRATAIRMT